MMKQLMVFCCLALLLASCKDDAKKDDTAVTTSGSESNATQVALPYELATPYRNWQWGSKENAAIAMTALKSFTDKDFEALANTLGDSIEITLDQYHEKMSRDSALSMFKAIRPTMNELTITMYDYESVISEDKKDEWVTLWYKQVWKDQAGKADSLNIIDDVKIQNGKMIELDEKIQRFPVKKS